MENELYNVIVLNDDYTPLRHVVHVLIDAFNKPEENAVDLALDMHKNGSSVVGTYPEDIARQRIGKAMEMSSEKYTCFKMKLEKAEA